jgi:hypothetical protein
MLAASMRGVFALFCLVFLAAPAGADGRIKNFQVALDGNRVLASLELHGAFDHRMIERLESGLRTTIVYRFELHSDRKRWYDNHLKSASFEVSAIYDAVSRSWTVHSRLDGELIGSRTVHDREALEEAMTKVERLPVFTLDDEVPRLRRLLLKARAETGTKTILSFIPVTIATDWEDSPKFRYPPPQR